MISDKRTTPSTVINPSPKEGRNKFNQNEILEELKIVLSNSKKDKKIMHSEKTVCIEPLISEKQDENCFSHRNKNLPGLPNNALEINNIETNINNHSNMGSENSANCNDTLKQFSLKPSKGQYSNTCSGYISAFVPTSSCEHNDIIANYDLSRQSFTHINVWNDPIFGICTKYDRFGFLMEKNHESVADWAEHDEKATQQDSMRISKWITMIKKENYNKYFGIDNSKDRIKMINRIYKGVPNTMRGKVWYILLELDTVKCQQGPGRYWEMLLLARKRSPYTHQIDMDVNRTYKNHIHFCRRYNIYQHSLLNVLLAYSVYNTEIGYCQGMAKIVAVLLIYLGPREDDVFWALSQLMVHPKYTMHGFFINGFPKVLRFQTHHSEILEKCLPKLKNHLDRLSVDICTYTFKWFLTCFLDSVPFKVAIRVWDLFILEGERVIITMAYTIMYLNCNNILQMNSLDQIIDFLQNQLKANSHFKDGDIFRKLRQNMKALQEKKLASPGPPPDIEIPKIPFGRVDGGILNYASLIESPEKRLPSDIMINQTKLRNSLNLEKEVQTVMDRKKQLQTELKKNMKVNDSK